jgi:hypothetical protein
MPLARTAVDSDFFQEPKKKPRLTIFFCRSRADIFCSKQFCRGFPLSFRRLATAGVRIAKASWPTALMVDVFTVKSW